MIINNIPKGSDIILASNSPRRRELMTGMGFPFRVAEPYPVEEVYPSDMEPSEVPLFLARLKSEAYPHTLNDNQILITADTIVILNGKVIGKPKDREGAIETLTTLSDSTHEVMTSVVMRNELKTQSFTATSRVTFAPLAIEEITFYVDNFRPYDKAGAYGIQEWIGYIGIERIEGSFYNVMGLPTRLLYTALSDFIKTQLYTDNQ